MVFIIVCYTFLFYLNYEKLDEVVDSGDCMY